MAEHFGPVPNALAKYSCRQRHSLTSLCPLVARNREALLDDGRLISDEVVYVVNLNGHPGHDPGSRQLHILWFVSGFRDKPGMTEQKRNTWAAIPLRNASPDMEGILLLNQEL